MRALWRLWGYPAQFCRVVTPLGGMMRRIGGLGRTEPVGLRTTSVHPTQNELRTEHQIPAELIVCRVRDGALGSSRKHPSPRAPLPLPCHPPMVLVLSIAPWGLPLWPCFHGSMPSGRSFHRCAVPVSLSGYSYIRMLHTVIFDYPWPCRACKIGLQALDYSIAREG